jgi:hypothetical protein
MSSRPTLSSTRQVLGFAIAVFLLLVSTPLIVSLLSLLVL